MKIKNIVIPVVGLVASVLIASFTPVEHQVQVGVIAGLVAIALGVWEGKLKSRKYDTSPLVRIGSAKGAFRMPGLDASANQIKSSVPASEKQPPEQP